MSYRHELRTAVSESDSIIVGCNGGIWGSFGFKTKVGTFIWVVIRVK